MFKPLFVQSILLSAAAALCGCGHAAAPAEPAAAPAAAPANTSPDSIKVDGAINGDVVKTALPVQQTVDETIPVTGKLSLDKQQVRIAAARVAGRLGRIFVFEGQSVKAGEPLAEIYSPDYISAENELLLAKGFRDTLSGGDADLKKDSESTYEAAASKLKVLGASEADIARLARSGKVEEYLQVRAPVSGVVTQRNVDPGGYLNIGDTLMTLANTDTLWLYFNSYDTDYARLKLGQELGFQTSSLPGRQFSGSVAFIAPSVDPATHTLPVRCDIPNPGMLLRPEMFVTGALKTGSASAWVVPKSAVFRIREQDYVVVQKGGAGQYQRLPVQGHPLDDGSYAITGGLDAAQPVVTQGAVLLNQLAGQGA